MTQTLRPSSGGGCSRTWIMRTKQLSTLMILIQLWQTTSGADPPPIIQRNVTVCFCCNETTAYFNWTHLLKPLLRIQWKFKDISMASYTNTALDFTQESLRISPNYKDRFHLLKQGGVGFRLNYVTSDDIGTYRLLITLDTVVVETLEGDLEEIERQEKVNLCSQGDAVFKWTLRNMSFSLIQWQVNGTMFARTTKTGFITDSLDISDDYRIRFRLLKQGDVGFQLDHVTRNDAGTYTCIITSQSREFTIVGDLEVKDQQSGDFNITVNKQRTLTCGETRDSTYSWIFSNTTERENETSTGHELPLSSIPQKGSVYCQRHSDCSSSLPYSFSSEADNHGVILAVIITAVILAIFIVLAIIIVVVRRKKTKYRKCTISKVTFTREGSVDMSVQKDGEDYSDEDDENRADNSC